MISICSKNQKKEAVSKNADTLAASSNRNLLLRRELAGSLNRVICNSFILLSNPVPRDIDALKHRFTILFRNQ